MELKIDLNTDIDLYDINIWIGENNHSERLSTLDNSINRLLSDRKTY